MDRFSYNKLASGPDQQIIRLLELQPGKAEEALRCSVTEVSLAETPEYEAISYCWGLEQVADRIICDDETYLPLNQSLSSALRYFRHDQGPRLLWADAICINQLDTDEKSRQVNMMRDVYRQSRRVLIWLGEE
ncbi:HET-domain-containing protein, partial [Polychaeton citri CBS 116435]